MPPLVELVPNVSEGRRPAIVERLARALGDAPGVRLLDVHSDPSHHRTVLTAVAAPDAVEPAALRLYEVALDAIDLRRHRGEHPRVGAVDVFPIVPLEGVTMDACAELARRLGRRIADRFDLPVYLYGAAAARPERAELPAIRRGEFEGLAEKMRSPEWRPDFGPAAPHPTAGATIIGARDILIAFNVNLATDRVEVAKAVARAVRHTNGGLRFVRALGLRIAEKGCVQVSMNLTDYRRTPIHRAYELVRLEAERRGVAVAGSEIVGLAPLEALAEAAGHYLRLDEGAATDRVLERRLWRREDD